jgi:hypothetical protein
MNAITLLSLLFACSEKDNKTQAPTPQKVETPSPKGTQDVVMLAPSTAEVASWNGGTLTYGDFTTEMMAEIKQKEATYLNERYTFERGALENKILEKVLGEEAKKTRID